MRQVSFPSAHCRVGAARCDITPPTGIYHRMWGAATHDRATGVHQPLTASALALAPLESDGLKVVLAIDHCLFWGSVMEGMLARLHQETGLPRSAFAITFSHTHAAGLMDPARDDIPGGELIAPYLDDLGTKLVNITRQATVGMRPAWLTFAKGRSSLAAQRDFWDENSGQYVCGYNPIASADDTVLVARVVSDRGEPVATVVNYACHPTTLAYQNTLISPDYPGTMRQLVEHETGAPCVFLQGASGDLGPREGYVGDVRVAERNGRQLGHAVLAALEQMPPPGTRYVYAGPVLSGATLGLWEHQAASDEEMRRWRRFRWRESSVRLPYRDDLPAAPQVEQDMQTWLAKENAARLANDDHGHREAHAMVERLRRLSSRLRQLPSGKEFPLPASLGHVGDSLWVFVEGEHYHWLQMSLRERFPRHCLFVVTLTNGWRCSYLPSADAYGKGIYQETVAVLAQGSLERLSARLEEELGSCVAEGDKTDDNARRLA